MSPVDTRPWLASIGAGRWQMAGIRSAQRAGINILAMDGDPAAPGLKTANHSIVVDIRDPHLAIDAAVASGITLAGAVSFAADVGLGAVGALREKFSLPGPGPSVLKLLTNKAAQRRVWQKAGLKNPVFWKTVEHVDQGLSVIAEAARPLIVKPVDSAGSRSITRLDTFASKQVRALALELALSGSARNQAIIESILPGREYTVETFSDGNATQILAMTVKQKVPNTNDTVANELATPTCSQDALDAIGKIARSALEAVGYCEGPGHVEVMYDPVTGPALIEAAGRGAGFKVFEGLVPLASDYDIVTATALQAVGELPPPITGITRPVVLRFFPSEPGRVRAISGFDHANALDGVEANPFVKVGDISSSAKSDGDRLGYILTTGTTSGEAHQRADRAEEIVQFDIAVDD